MLVGIDVGGTFTDFVVVDSETGEQRQHKVPSTPANPADAVVNGLTDLGIPIRSYDRIVHGTTVATNTIIQRSGVTTGLITTEGHRDTLAIRRGTKPERQVFNNQWVEPEPLVPRYLRLDVRERMNARGEVVVELDEDELRLAVEHLVEHGAEAVAVCFLFSYLNDTHERRAEEIIGAMDVPIDVSRSSDILPQWREFERSVTTVADAYIKPVMRHYIDELATRLDDQGFSRDLLIMRSNGGVMTAASAAERPIETFLSGPAGGVVAGMYYGRQVGEANVITIDIGGTSFDAAMISEGRLSTTTESWIDDVTPLNIAMLDIRTIGAGGGSIAWIDAGGALKVGPRSAGADPGPACYGRGGSEPTVTDANVVLGRLGAKTLLGGRLEIDEQAARAAIDRHVAKPLGLSVEAAAEGIVRICVANMAAELKAMTAEQGVNPRDFAILAGGGGGPLHAAALAAEFGIARVIVPAFPGLLSAGGLVLSDLRVDRLKSFRCRLERDGADALAAAASDLVEEVVEALHSEGYQDEPVVEVSLDMKYSGQNWEIRVEVPTTIDAGELRRRFDETHHGLYGFSLPGHTHEVLSIRATAIGPNSAASESVPRRTPGTAATDRPPSTSRRMWDDAKHQFVDGSVYAWDDMGEGATVRGPAIIEGMDSTVWLPGDGHAVVDEYGNVIVDLKART